MEADREIKDNAETQSTQRLAEKAWTRHNAVRDMTLSQVDFLYEVNW
jgi:hypothetical protein